MVIIYIVFCVQHVEVLFTLYNYLSNFWLDISEFNEKSKRRVEAVFGKQHFMFLNRTLAVMVLVITGPW